MWDTICSPWAQRRAVQAKGLEHIFSKLTAGDSQNPGKEIGRRHPSRRPEDPASLRYICKHSEHTKHTEQKRGESYKRQASRQRQIHQSNRNSETQEDTNQCISKV